MRNTPSSGSSRNRRRWRRCGRSWANRARSDGEGFQSRRLDATEALTTVPFFYKDLGVFGLDRPDSPERSWRLSAYSQLFRALTVIEVRGRWDFVALGELVSDLLR